MCASAATHIGASQSNSLFFLSFTHLVRVRTPTNLRLTRTFTEKELKLPDESKNIWITCIIECTSDVLILVDRENKTVKSVDVHSGTSTASILFRESTQEWYIWSVLLVGGDANQRLLIPESMGAGRSTSKRLVVATRAASNTPFTHTYDIPFQDDNSVGSSSGAHFIHSFLHSALFPPFPPNAGLRPGWEGGGAGWNPFGGATEMGRFGGGSERNASDWLGNVRTVNW